MRRILLTLLLATNGVVAAASLAVAQADKPTAKPNVVLIMADDFGYECVTANGGESYQTPNLDRLAASGVPVDSWRVAGVIHAFIHYAGVIKRGQSALREVGERLGKALTAPRS